MLPGSVAGLRPASQQSRSKSSDVASPTTTTILKGKKAATPKSSKVSPIGFVCTRGCGCFFRDRCWGADSHTEEDKAQWKAEKDLKRQLHNYRVEQTMARLRALKLYDDPMAVETPATNWRIGRYSATEVSLKSTASSTENTGATKLTVTHDDPSLKAGAKADPGDSKMEPKAPSEPTLESIAKAADETEAQQGNVELKKYMCTKEQRKEEQCAEEQRREEQRQEAKQCAEEQRREMSTVAESHAKKHAKKNAKQYYSKMDPKQTKRAIIKQHAHRNSMTSKAVQAQMKQNPDMVLSESDQIQALVKTFVNEKLLFRESDGKWIEVGSWPEACVESGKVLTRDKKDM